ncbi:hypothetical protein QOT17_007599 [Balamuthia mandrillaris]
MKWGHQDRRLREKQARLLSLLREQISAYRKVKNVLELLVEGRKRVFALWRPVGGLTRSEVKINHDWLRSYHECPFQFCLKYVYFVKLPSQVTIDQIRGNALHSTVDQLAKARATGKDISRQRLNALFEETWNEQMNKSKDMLIPSEVEDHKETERKKREAQQWIGKHFTYSQEIRSTVAEAVVDTLNTNVPKEEQAALAATTPMAKTFEDINEVEEETRATIPTRKAKEEEERERTTTRRRRRLGQNRPKAPSSSTELRLVHRFSIDNTGYNVLAVGHVDAVQEVEAFSPLSPPLAAALAAADASAKEKGNETKTHVQSYNEEEKDTGFLGMIFSKLHTKTPTTEPTTVPTPTTSSPNSTSQTHTVLWEYKSSQRAFQKLKSDPFQLKFYLWLWEKRFQKRPYMGCGHAIQSGDRFEIMATEETFREMDQIVEESVKSFFSADVFRANPSRSACSHCEFKDRCPASAVLYSQLPRAESKPSNTPTKLLDDLLKLSREQQQEEQRRVADLNNLLHEQVLARRANLESLLSEDMLSTLQASGHELSLNLILEELDQATDTKSNDIPDPFKYIFATPTSVNSPSTSSSASSSSSSSSSIEDDSFFYAPPPSSSSSFEITPPSTPSSSSFTVNPYANLTKFFKNYNSTASTASSTFIAKDQQPNEEKGAEEEEVEGQLQQEQQTPKLKSVSTLEEQVAKLRNLVNDFFPSFTSPNLNKKKTVKRSTKPQK